MKKLLTAVAVIMILGAPFSWAGAQVDRLALQSYPYFKLGQTASVATTATNVYVKVLDFIPYPGFHALALRYMYLSGQEATLWSQCERGQVNSSFTSVRLYCYNLAWDYDRETAIQIGSTQRFYYYDLFVYQENPRDYLTRVMLTAWRNGQIMRQAATLARSLNLQDVANLYNRTSQGAAY
jgi:hypothetical protein